MGGPLLVNHARFGEITAGQTFKVFAEGLSPVLWKIDSHKALQHR